MKKDLPHIYRLMECNIIARWNLNCNEKEIKKKQITNLK